MAAAWLTRLTMSGLLALDIGMKRTGVAFSPGGTGIVMALDTIKHRSTQELVEALTKIATEKKFSAIVIGLPLLPQGGEGEQVFLVREVGKAIEAALAIPVSFLDERYTTSAKRERGTDVDARAACDLLSVALDKRDK